MGDAKKCDRCGALYEISEAGGRFKLIGAHEKDVKKSFDLCPKCQNELDLFIPMPIQKSFAPVLMKELIPSSLYDKNLEELGFSTRLWNVLFRGLALYDRTKYGNRHEIKVKDICNLEYETMRNLRNMGVKTWKEFLNVITKETEDGKFKEEQSSRDDNI